MVSFTTTLLTTRNFLLGIAILSVTVPFGWPLSEGHSQEIGRERPSQHGIVERANIWPVVNISICWEDDYSSYSSEKGWVQDAVRELIDGNSLYRLSTTVLWPRCPKDDLARIRILLQDARDADGQEIPPHSEVGYQHTVNAFGFSTPAPTHISLNVTFKNSFVQCGTSAARKLTCIKVISVHEMLHALGFLHEQYNTNLQDTDKACYDRIAWSFAKDTRGTSPWSITEYDPDSIMNYCRDIYKEPPRLSILDIRTLRAVYNASYLKMTGHD
jgi:Astacin (Peptidase family M12A)